MTAPRFRPLLVPGLAFFFLISPALSGPADIPYEWTGIETIVVIGDLHGAYNNFVKILKGTGLVDRDLRWAAGRIHLVQTGDIMDRGEDARKIFDVLIRLEKEAEAVGGKVHVLLGNHEEMNLTGVVFSSNPDSVTLDQFIKFLPDAYREERERELEKKIVKLRSRGNDRRKVMNAFWKSQRESKSAQRKYVVNLNDEYGDWLRQLNVAIKINDVVFVHGGISEKYSNWGLREINDRYRLELNDYWRAYRRSVQPRIIRPSILYRGDSPLWYRELATVPEEEIEPELDASLENLGAKTMVIAHTPQLVKTALEMQRFGGKVWIVDTGIADIYGGPAAALIIQNGYFNVWGLDNEDSNESPYLPSFFDSPQFGPFLGASDSR